MNAKGANSTYFRFKATIARIIVPSRYIVVRLTPARFTRINAVWESITQRLLLVAIPLRMHGICGESTKERHNLVKFDASYFWPTLCLI